MRWIGVALLAPAEGSEQARHGYNGAYGAVACAAETLAAAVERLAAEFSENHVELRGFDWLFPLAALDRPLTEYEEALVARLEDYPIQFRDLHWFRDWSSRH